MPAPTLIPGIDAFRDFVGKPLGPSDWIEVTQERIDRFAEATGDRQWIHVDPERARRESPFRVPVAHGYLTLSLAPALLGEIVRVEGEPTVLNTGLDKMRLSAPVPSGSRVRLRAEIKNARDMLRGGVHVTFRLVLEVEGAERPACTADVALVYLARGASAS
jgi:acyl dehydratase